MNSFRQFLKRFLIFVISFYVICLITVTVFQRSMMYHPDTTPVTPDQMGLNDVQQITLHTADDETLQAWYHAAEEGEATLAYFHGNAGNLAHRAERIRQTIDAGFGLLMTSYRGFGSSTGSPNETGLYTDAAAAMDYLLKDQHIAPDHIIIYGESLGTGVAVEMATRYDVRGLVLEAPYTSVEARAQEMFPWLPVPWLIRDHYDSLSKIRSVNEPLLLFHGEEDMIIPIHHGRTLFEAANEPKKAYFLPFIYHHNFDRIAVNKAIKEFFNLDDPN